MRILIVCVLAACGSSSSHPDAMVDAYATAPHAAYPQVPDHGGPKLAHPQIVTVTFANDPRAAEFEAYAQWIVTSAWLGTVGAEYGVGAGGIAGVAHRPETPGDVTSADIEGYLATGVMDGSIPKPASLADALYIIYYPSTTHITTTFVNGIIKKSCVDFGGYHGEVHQGGMDFAYSAIPDCGPGGVDGLTANELTEYVVSHEIIEAATDAMPITAPAVQLTPDPTDAWFTAFEFEVEVGDLCEAPLRFVREDNHVATRSWSNAAAAVGEPCVPIDPALPAFGITATPAGTQMAPPNGSLDFTLAGWSTGTVPDWKITNELSGTAHGKVTLSAPTVNNGGSVTAHVVIPGVASGTHATIFLVSSHTPTDATMWPLSIDVQ